MKSLTRTHRTIVITGIVSFILFIFLIISMLVGIFQLTSNNCGSNSDGVASLSNVSTSDVNGNDKKIFDFFVQKEGFSGAGAAAAVGNALIESTYDPKADNGNHVGIFQWGTGDRLRAGNIINSPADYTLENELKLADYELNHNYRGVKDKVGHASDPQSASLIWQNEYEVAPGQATEKRQAASQEAYRRFGGENISANDSLLGNIVAAGEAGANSDASSGQTCSNGGSGEGSSDMVSIAKKLLGYFTYSYARPVLPATMNNPNSHDVNDVKRDGTTDCSGFVWLVCYLAGYKVPAGGWYTGSMYTDATGPHQYLKQVDESSAKAGDIVVCGGPASSGQGGHTAILAENWHGKDTKIINEGGGGDNVNEHTFEWSFGSLGDDQRIFCEPVAKN